MILRTIGALLACEWIQHVYVVVAGQDPHQKTLQPVLDERCSVLPVGGPSRRDTVLAGLKSIEEAMTAAAATNVPWVMVHDAARPGVSVALLERLRDCILAQSCSAISADPFGALLAMPLADTIKRQADGNDTAFARVDHTVDRTGLWAAQTPQVFPLDVLRRALAGYEQATDEASAIEKSGRSPALVPGHWHNMKVTTTEDLALMSRVFEERQ